MAAMEGEVIKGLGVLLAAVLALFGLKTRIVKDVTKEIEDKLKLHIDLLHAEAKLIEEKNKQSQIDIFKLEAQIALKLSEKEHIVRCSAMEKSISRVEKCITDGFEILHQRMNKRRATNGG